ncbi:putative calcium-binding protein CML41 [Apostasia shenzhenica]|uniref:Putative calcium-binding protein CML41 n=1 Tax=Apostasia shenzhenica TaxID=1088818 RepID=A0A2I0B7P8_9ASPA|nr:putative calcium-binding protein CML41 [Apostasia shenzhenica]
MAAANNPSKNRNWFSNKTLLKLSLHRLRRSKRPAALPSADQQECSFREVFRLLDADGDGRISSEEIRSFLAWSGDHMSPEEAAAVLLDLNPAGGGLIGYEDFVQLVNGGQPPGGEGYEEDLRRAFEMFEGKEGAGGITPDGLQTVLTRLGEARTREECAAMIRVYDVDGNGVLDYHEFCKMMG